MAALSPPSSLPNAFDRRMSVVPHSAKLLRKSVATETRMLGDRTIAIAVRTDETPRMRKSRTTATAATLKAKTASSAALLPFTTPSHESSSATKDSARYPFWLVALPFPFPLSLPSLQSKRPIIASVWASTAALAPPTAIATLVMAVVAASGSAWVSGAGVGVVGSTRINGTTVEDLVADTVAELDAVGAITAVAEMVAVVVCGLSFDAVEGFCFVVDADCESVPLALRDAVGSNDAETVMGLLMVSVAVLAAPTMNVQRRPASSECSQSVSPSER